MARVLIADPLSAEATRILTAAGLDVDAKPGRGEAEIIADINQYDGLVVRSATNVTRAIIEADARLKVIGRAGVGVDNIDLDAATERGIVVMNAPLGNIVSAAEHTIAMVMALARDIPSAHAEMQEGIWNRSAHTGIELEGKTLGIIGLGKVGQHVAKVFKAGGMDVIAYDPFISAERAAEIGVSLVGLDDVLAKSDVLTLHVPKTPQTTGLIDTAALEKMKPTARLVNVARGGIVVEADLAAALAAGTIAGAAVDVFSVEPISPDNPLLQAPNIVLTPHLGASTAEAQTKVADAIARQFVAFFQTGLIQNAVNLQIALDPSLRPFAQLALTLGSLAVQLQESPRVQSVHIHCQGNIAKQDTRALSVSALSGVLQQTGHSPVNLVNASHLARVRGIELIEERSRQIKNYVSLLTVTVQTDSGRRTVSGTCFDERALRIVAIDGLEIDLKPDPHILIMKYGDRPGMVGKFGTILGDAKLNIAGMEVGRTHKGADAIVALTLDDPVPESVQQALRAAIQPHELYVVSL